MITKKYRNNKRIAHSAQRIAHSAKRTARILILNSVFAFYFLLGPTFCLAQEKAAIDDQVAPSVDESTSATPSLDKKSELPDNKPIQDAPDPFQEPLAIEGSSSGAQPIEINGDKIDFSSDSKEVTVTGNAMVIYNSAKLTCDTLKMDNKTKDVVAQGHARLENETGAIEGEKLFYNLNTQSGIIYDADFRANPYFGRAEKCEKMGEDKFINNLGYLTTCNLEKPHWRLKSRKMTIYPGERVNLKDSVFYAGELPFFYMPEFGRSLKDPIMQVQLMPGNDRDWGPFILSAWRYNFNDDLTGRIYFDERANYGNAQGFGVNYANVETGKGNFKFYYTQERNKNEREFDINNVDEPKVFERYMIRWRHKWDIDADTNFTSEYYKIVDSKMILYPDHSPTFNFLKEYFYREYEKDAQPLSYLTVHRGLNYATMDFYVQMRTNRWYSQWEKLPEVTASLPSYHVPATPFYWTNSTSFGNYTYKNAVPSPSSADKFMVRMDTTNNFSLPMKVAFVNFNPYVQHEGTYYSHDTLDTSNLFRTIFTTGADASTKFYRIFNTKSNFLGLDINGLRHIITPTIKYSFNNKPTISSSRLIQMDSVDSISGVGNSATMEVSNILQTKRKGVASNLAELLVNNTYSFKTHETKSNLGNFVYKLYLYPYSWLSGKFETTYDHKQNIFPNYNYDISLNIAEGRTFNFTQRFQRKGPNEFMGDIKWRLSPKWKVGFYGRLVSGHRDANVKRGLREQEWFLSRDLHCWDVDLTYNVKRDLGESIWLVFRLKAFPELNFEYNQQYHQPKAGELSY